MAVLSVMPVVHLMCSVCMLIFLFINCSRCFCSVCHSFASFSVFSAFSLMCIKSLQRKQNLIDSIGYLNVLKLTWNHLTINRTSFGVCSNFLRFWLYFRFLLLYSKAVRHGFSSNRWTFVDTSENTKEMFYFNRKQSQFPFIITDNWWTLSFVFLKWCCVSFNSSVSDRKSWFSVSSRFWESFKWPLISMSCNYTKIAQ